jgi:hypothetical protein
LSVQPSSFIALSGLRTSKCVQFLAATYRNTNLGSILLHFKPDATGLAVHDRTYIAHVDCHFASHNSTLWILLRWLQVPSTNIHPLHKHTVLISENAKHLSNRPLVIARGHDDLITLFNMAWHVK